MPRSVPPLVPEHVYAWSYTRHRLLAECERAVFWSYIGCRGHGLAPAAAPVAQFRPFAQQIARRLGQDVAALRFNGCRRVPPLESGASSESVNPLPHAGARRTADLDRADVLLALGEHLDAPRTRTLLTAAHAVLGWVIRDPAWVERKLGELGPSDPVVRRALAVASGLLGVPPSVRHAVPTHATPVDVAAWILGTVLADPGEAGAVLQVARADAPPLIADACGTALHRLAVYPFTAAE